MKLVVFSLFISSVLLLVSLSLDKDTTESNVQSVEHHLVVKVIGNEWRVVHANDSTKSTVRAKRGDRVRFVVEGSDASFQFPEAKIFGQNTVTVKAGRPLTLPVTPAAVKGDFPYAVFVHKDMVFARGESPPRIIIE